MKETKKDTNIRFYEKNKADMRAWDILHHIDKGKYKSQSAFVVAAINSYYDRVIREEADPMLSTREKEDAFIERILEVISGQLKEQFPTMLGLSFMQMQNAMLNSQSSLPAMKTGNLEKLTEETGKDSNSLNDKESDEEPPENEALDYGLLGF